MTFSRSKRLPYTDFGNQLSCPRCSCSILLVDFTIEIEDKVVSQVYGMMVINVFSKNTVHTIDLRESDLAICKNCGTVSIATFEGGLTLTPVCGFKRLPEIFGKNIRLTKEQVIQAIQLMNGGN